MKYFTTGKLSENIHETPEGYLLCLGVSFARTGEQLYAEGETPLDVGPDGKIVIERLPDDVFRDETIASFEGKPFTVGHPDDFVGPHNHGELANGVLQNVRRGVGIDAQDLVADILVTGAQAIGLIRRGVREVSAGYEAEYIQTGEGRGRQVNIIGNHLALVEQGRAGPAYAINDHKGVSMKTKLKERVKALFARATDEATKVIDEDMPEEKKEPAKDEAGMAYDAIMKAVADLSEKVAALKPKDAAPAEEKKDDKKADDAAEGDKPEEKKMDDAAEGTTPGVEDRLKALEMAVAKLMEGEALEAADEDEPDTITDEDEGEESEDAPACTGDAASRAEILAPGIEKTKDVKVKALKAAYATKEGKAVLDSLTGGKVPTYDSAEKVEHLFIAASEILKAKRTDAAARTKQPREVIDGVIPGTPMTPERMNQINAQHFGLK